MKWLKLGELTLKLIKQIGIKDLIVIGILCLLVICVVIETHVKCIGICL